MCSQSSNMLNQARLKVLKVREDHVKTVLDDARKKLSEVSRDQGKYAEILKLLITQGLYQVYFFLLQVIHVSVIFENLINYCIF